LKDDYVILRAAPAFGALTLLLAACSPPAPEPADAPLDAVRMSLPTQEPVPLPMAHPSGVLPEWTAAPDGLSARVGYPGEAAQLSLECRAGTLVVTRNVPAPVGAAALFALQGSGLILRLPVDATALPGQHGYVWQGMIAPSDPRLALFDSSFNGTLPGAGHIEVPASKAPGAVIKRCRGGTPSP
jgi:hypothetical protein